MTRPLAALGLPEEVRNVVFLGEAGCGKSELAVSLSLALAQVGEPVHLFDLDMTKPLFRVREHKEALEAAGIALHFEEQFMDAPTLTGGVTRLLREDVYAVLDVGGDYIGARAVGGYAPLLSRPDAALCYVINPFRPWSGTLEHIDKVLGQILGVTHLALPALRLIANPNLGPGTTPEDVAEGFDQLTEQVSPYKPIEACAVRREHLAALEGRIPVPLFPLDLMLTYPWDGDEIKTCV